MKQPCDRKGREIDVGVKVRLLSLSGIWYEELPIDEKDDINSMIGKVFIIEEIDDYGQPWIRKSWKNQKEGTCNSHSIAVESHEVEIVNE